MMDGDDVAFTSRQFALYSPAPHKTSTHISVQIHTRPTYLYIHAHMLDADINISSLSTYPSSYTYRYTWNIGIHRQVEGAFTGRRVFWQERRVIRNEEYAVLGCFHRQTCMPVLCLLSGKVEILTDKHTMVIHQSQKQTTRRRRE